MCAIVVTLMGNQIIMEVNRGGGGVSYFWSAVRFCYPEVQ